MCVETEAFSFMFSLCQMIEQLKASEMMTKVLLLALTLSASASAQQFINLCTDLAPFEACCIGDGSDSAYWAMPQGGSTIDEQKASCDVNPAGTTRYRDFKYSLSFFSKVSPVS